MVVAVIDSGLTTIDGTFGFRIWDGRGRWKVPAYPGAARRRWLRADPYRQPIRPPHRAPARLAQGAQREVMSVNPALDLDHAPRRQKVDDGARLNCWSASEARTFLAAANADGPVRGTLCGRARQRGT